jgi:copper resistance protein C
MTGGVLTRFVAAASLSVLFLAPGLASPASAHTELDNAVPAADVTLERTPGSVQLNFTEPIDAELASVVVRGPDGANLVEGTARQSGPGLIQPIRAAARAGLVEVSYRVVSLDGHPVSGTYTFEVLRGDPNASPGEPGAGAGGASDDGAGTDVSLLGPLLGAAAVALLVLTGALLARRRRARNAPAGGRTPLQPDAAPQTGRPAP